MSKATKSTMQEVEKTREEEDQEMVESENDNSELEETCDDDDEERVPIDLSENEIYKGVCTLLEDEEGNNILEYISLLHTELIGINKSLENLKPLRKDITRLADCAELLLKSQKVEVPVEKKQSESHRDEHRKSKTATKTSTKV
jgi:hypothetical protein